MRSKLQFYVYTLCSAPSWPGILCHHVSHVLADVPWLGQMVKVCQRATQRATQRANRHSKGQRKQILKFGRGPPEPWQILKFMRQILVQRMIYILPNLGSGRERDFCVVSMWHRLMALRVVYLTDGRTRMWARLEFCCGPVVLWYVRHVLTSTWYV